MNRASAAALLTRHWVAGVCHFCGVGEDEIDGDRLRWYDGSRAVCSRPGCIRQFADLVDRAAQPVPRPRRLSPGEVHARIMEERRRKRKQYREAAKARRSAGKGHAA